MQNHNILLTGIPRSGTTLCCALLNQLSDVLALIEPMDVAVFFDERRPDRWRQMIDEFFERSRASIRLEGNVMTQIVSEAGQDNTFSRQKNARGLRQSIIAPGEWRIDKPLSQNFTLLIKHPNAFTAMLEHLVDYVPCYAIIRNPLAVLASWNTLPIPLKDGHAPAAERVDGALTVALAAIDDRHERQLCLLSWYYQQYKRYLEERYILRYEEIIASRGRCLKRIVPRAEQLNSPLQDKNDNALYERRLMRILGQRLLQSEGCYWEFYSRSAVLELLEAIEHE